MPTVSTERVRDVRLPRPLATRRGPASNVAQLAPAAKVRSRPITVWQQWLPMTFFQTYLGCSLLAFAFGPIDTSVPNPTQFYAYLIAGQVSLLIGYWLGARPSREPRFDAIRWGTMLRCSIGCTLLLLPATLAARNMAGMSITAAILNPGEAYMARLSGGDEDAANFVLSVLRVLGAPILRPLAPIGLVCWPAMSVRLKLVWSLAVIGALCEGIYTGAAIGLFDIVLVAPWMLLLQSHYCQSPSSHRAVPSAALPIGGLLRWAMVVSVIFVGVVYFSHSRQSRFGMSGDEYPPWTTGWSAPKYGVALPASIEYPAYTIVGYWTNGYHGLAECLDLPFEWCYGVGHSTFLMRRVGGLLGDQSLIWERSYVARLEATTGYSAVEKWHTIYPWLASDFTYGGALVVVGLLGFLLARVWFCTLQSRGVLAVALLSQLLLVIYYIPANNGRLSYPEESLAFWCLLGAWLYAGHRRTRLRAPAGVGRAR